MAFTRIAVLVKARTDIIPFIEYQISAEFNQYAVQIPLIHNFFQMKIDFLTFTTTLVLIYAIRSSKVFANNSASLSKIEVETDDDSKIQMTDSNEEVIQNYLTLDNNSF